jgi:AraC-like DNA-binding protein
MPVHDLDVSDPNLRAAGGADVNRLSPRDPGVHLTQIGCCRVDPRWDRRELVNPFWRAYLADRPGLSLTRDRRRMPYPVDAITVIPAWCPFVFHADPAVVHAFIHFAVPELPGALVRAVLPAPLHLRDPGLVARFRVFARGLSADGEPVAAGLRAGALARECLVAVLAGLSAERRRRLLAGAGAGGGHRLDAALALIDRRLDRPLAVAEVAQALGVGPAQATRLFRRLVGTTPQRYILERRIERAAELLVSGDEGMDAIARRCGLGNRSYLSRVFTRRCGLGPAAYRRQQRGGDRPPR